MAKMEIMSKLKHSDADTGVDLSMSLMNGNIVLEFSEPVKTLGLTPRDAMALILGLVEGGMHAEKSQATASKTN